MLGNSLAAVVLPILVLVKTGSVLDAGWVALATGVSTCLVGVATGPLTDRVNRRAVSAISDTVSGLSVLALACVLAFVSDSVVWFIVFAVLGAVGDMPGLNAREAMLPRVVASSTWTASQLTAAKQGMAALAVVAGPGSAGLLLHVMSPNYVLFVTAGFSVLAAGLTLGLAQNDYNVPRGESSYVQELTSGFRAALFSSPTVRGLTVSSALSVMLIAGVQNLLIPVYYVAKEQPSGVGFALAAVGAGLLFGGGLFAFSAARFSPRSVLLVSLTLSFVAAVGVSTFRSHVIVLTGAFLLGLFSGPVGGVVTVASIDAIDEEVRGRVTSVQNALSIILAPLSIFFCAIGVQHWGLQQTGVVLSLLWFCTTVASLRFGTIVPKEAPAPTGNPPHT